MNRRRFIIGLSALGVAHAAAAQSEPGISAAPDLLKGIEGLKGVSEGVGGTMHVLYTPWCHLSPTLYRDTRPFLGRMKVNWIPFSGGQPEGKTGTELLLSSGLQSDIPKSFMALGPLQAAQQTPLADAQDAALSHVMPLYYRDVGGSLSTPTIFYRMAGDRIRVVKGAPQPRHLEVIALVAA
jgi:hypothetical protein